MYQNILLATDGSEYSLRAAREAARIANCSDDSLITILFVADFEKSKEAVLHAPNKETLEAERKRQLLPIEKILREYAAPYKIHILHGDPAAEIINFEHAEEVDLLVIGSRGLNTLQEMLLGSVSHKVMKRVSCPVLLVK